MFSSNNCLGSPIDKLNRQLLSQPYHLQQQQQHNTSSFSTKFLKVIKFTYSNSPKYSKPKLIRHIRSLGGSSSLQSWLPSFFSRQYGNNPLTGLPITIFGGRSMVGSIIGFHLAINRLLFGGQKFQPIVPDLYPKPNLPSIWG